MSNTKPLSNPNVTNDTIKSFLSKKGETVVGSNDVNIKTEKAESNIEHKEQDNLSIEALSKMLNQGGVDGAKISTDDAKEEEDKRKQKEQQEKEQQEKLEKLGLAKQEEIRLVEEKKQEEQQKTKIIKEAQSVIDDAGFFKQLVYSFLSIFLKKYELKSKRIEVAKDIGLLSIAKNPSSEVSVKLANKINEYKSLSVQVEDFDKFGGNPPSSMINYGNKANDRATQTGNTKTIAVQTDDKKQKDLLNSRRDGSFGLQNGI